MDDFVLIPTKENKANSDKEYKSLMERIASKPFCVETSGGKLWYYLSYKFGEETFEKAREDVLKVDGCRACGRNFKKIHSLFGEKGYALDFGCVKDPSVYQNVNTMRVDTENRDIDGVFVVDASSLRQIPRQVGKHPVTGKNFIHMNLKVSSEFQTCSRVNSTYAGLIQSRVNNDTMDTRLFNLITELQAVRENGKCFMENLESAMGDSNLLRKPFWTRKVDYVKTIQEFTSKFEHGKDWEKMSPENKMHTRVFALTRGESTSATQIENTLFKESGQVVDCYKDVSDPAAMASFMNSRSNPESYMVRQVAKAIEDKHVVAKFKVSLAWNDNTDLDLWVKTDKGEKIGFSNLTSIDRMTRLDFDANAGSPTKEAVENITMNHTRPGVYEVYVNNYNSRTKNKAIPYTLITNLMGEIEVFEGSWDHQREGDNSGSTLARMHHITRVVITPQMVADASKDVEMSNKEASRYGAHKSGFDTEFGTIVPSIVDLSKEPSAILLGVNKFTTATSMMDKMALSSRKTRSASKDFAEMMKSHGKQMIVNCRKYPPTYLTSHMCSSGNTVTKTAIIANTFYDKGRAPRHPDAETTSDTCRFDNSWCSSLSAKVDGLIAVKGPGYDGYFLSLTGTHLPFDIRGSRNQDWVLGGGMYPTDLKTEYHIYRDIWQSNHTLCVPAITSISKNYAIGIFLHKGKGYDLGIPGVSDPVLIN